MFSIFSNVFNAIGKGRGLQIGADFANFKEVNIPPENAHCACSAVREKVGEKQRAFMIESIRREYSGRQLWSKRIQQGRAKHATFPAFFNDAGNVRQASFDGQVEIAVRSHAAGATRQWIPSNLRTDFNILETLLRMPKPNKYLPRFKLHFCFHLSLMFWNSMGSLKMVTNWTEGQYWGGTG
jgi:hypothetical protein